MRLQPKFPLPKPSCFLQSLSYLPAPVARFPPSLRPLIFRLNKEFAELASNPGSTSQNHQYLGDWEGGAWTMRSHLRNNLDSISEEHNRVTPRPSLTFVHLTNVSALVAADIRLCKTGHARQRPADPKFCPSPSWARAALQDPPSKPLTLCRRRGGRGSHAENHRQRRALGAFLTERIL